MNRLLFVNRSYWPDVEATGQLLTQLCEDLAGDWDVHVLAGQPNLNVRAEGYQVAGREQRLGVTIHRVRHARFAKRSFLGRVVNLLSFFVAAWLQGSRMPRPEVLIVESDPFLLPLLGKRWKKRHGCRLVVYLQDIYPDVAIAVGKIRDGGIARWLRRRLIEAYRQADRVVVLSEDMRGRLQRHGVPEDRIALIPNWADTAQIVPCKTDNPFRLDHDIDDKFVVMYSGNMGYCQGLDCVLDLAQAVQDRDDIVFLMVGDGALRPQLEARSRELGLNNIRFLPYQPRESLSESLSAADLHLVPLDVRVTGCLMPSKLYGVMAAGSAILAIAAEDSDLFRLVQEQEIGRSATPEDLPLLEQSVLWCADHREQSAEMGRKARRLAEAVYDREHSVSLFHQLLCELVGREMPATKSATLGMAQTSEEVSRTP